jgi:hypothetical protein
MRERMRGQKSIPDIEVQPSSSTPTNTCFEQHCTPQQLAALWGWKPRRVHELFRFREDVLIVKNEGKGKRQYTTITIPKSTVERVYVTSRCFLVSARTRSNRLRRDRTHLA